MDTPFSRVTADGVILVGRSEGAREEGNEGGGGVEEGREEAPGVERS